VSGHPGDLISAWLDGELAESDGVAVAAHLAVCPACSAEHEEVAAARALLRGLPLIDAPPGVLRPMLATVRPHRPRGRTALVGAAAVAAGVLGLVATAQPVLAQQPAMATLVAEHAGAALPVVSASALALGQPAAPAAPVEADAPASLPPAYRLVRVEHSSGVVHATYADGGHALSLFSRLKGAGLAGAHGSGMPVTVGQANGRRWDVDAGVVIAWSTHGVSYAVVTDAPGSDAIVAASSVRTATSPDVASRTRTRCRRLLDVIG
jgi:anti-sigma factor RsiW